MMPNLRQIKGLADPGPPLPASAGADTAGKPIADLLSPATATAALPAERRVFLLLQGPHGPFFNRVARLLRDAGAAAITKLRPHQG